MAAYANANIKLVHGLKLTVGARESYDETNSSVFTAGPFIGGTTLFNGKTHSTPFTPKVALSWQANPDNMYYVSASKGFRVGGVNAVTNNPNALCQSSLAKDGLTGKLKSTYQPDSLWSYEVGAKNRLFGDRLLLESSAYYINWSNIQQIAPIFGCGFPVTFNLGNAKIKGADLNLQTRPTKHLKLGLEVGYTDAYFSDTVGGFVSAGDQIGSGATTEPSAPWTGTFTAEYDWRVGQDDAYAWFEDIAQSKNPGPLNTQNPKNVVIYDPALPANPATNQMNVRLGLVRGDADISLFVNNLLNSHPLLDLQHTSFGDPRFEALTFRPRTIGITVVYTPGGGN